MTPEATAAHYKRQQALTAATLVAARRQWEQLRSGEDFDVVWKVIGLRLLLLLSRAQHAAARDAVRYIAAVTAELELRARAVAGVRVDALAGVASDGRDLESLLYSPVTLTKARISEGASAEAALDAGERSLVEIVRTQVADAGRGASGVAIAARPAITGYVRMLNPPSCSRCVILAGKFFRWNEGFLRHPNCDCRHIPATEDVAGDLRTDPYAYFGALTEDEQDQAFTAAGARAIREGADLNQVVNARRGSLGLTFAGHRVRATTEASTVRGLAGKRLGAKSKRPALRLMPEALYEIADGDRDEAVRLLHKHGYLI